MRLVEARIRNFRGLKNIEFSTSGPVTVIVGPNAVGKTSIFEAIRLHKALLSPTLLNESITVLSNMGAFFGPTQSILADSLMGDRSQKLEIRLTIEFADAEIATLESQMPQLATLHLRNRLAVPPGQQELGLLQFLSSDEGRKQLDQATVEMRESVQSLRAAKRISPTLLIDPKQGAARGQDLVSQELLAGFLQSVPPTQTLLNYFPSDRAMPTGEVPIQLGATDTAAQMQSYIAQPATKYARLKQYLVTQFMRGEQTRDELHADFNQVFKSLLPGKHLANLRLSPQGTLSVTIQDENTKALYDLDYMSSGEKGLLCTFFLMRRSTAPGGIILLDEPELHLNPGVCRQILPFLLEAVVKPLGVQILICTHSPEVLAFAHENNDCELLHIVNGSEISEIHSEDKRQAFEALRRLGVQTMDVLFSRGSVFVEGTDSTELLQSGFPERLAGYKVTQLRGRPEIEKNIKSLQGAEAKGELDSLQCFVFDRDRAPTELHDTTLVKVLQWERYCLENYLLDNDAIYEVCESKDLKVGDPPASRGSVRNTLRDLAFEQIRGVVARRIYEDLEVDNPGLRPSEVDSAADYETIAASLSGRLQNIKTQLGIFHADVWTKQFVEKCKELDKTIHEEWNDKWMTECNGKLVLEDLREKLKLNVSQLAFKRRVIEQMARKQTENWRTLDSFLAGKLIGH